MHNRDMMFIDHKSPGYFDGDGPGNEYYKEFLRNGGSQTVGSEPPITRWTPKITIREDNTTCITTNTSGKNGQMKELEKAFGVYVSWNCSRLQSGDYVMVYTLTHDISADIYIYIYIYIQKALTTRRCFNDCCC